MKGVLNIPPAMTEYQYLFFGLKNVVVITRWSYYRVGRKAGLPHNVLSILITPHQFSMYFS